MDLCPTHGEIACDVCRRIALILATEPGTKARRHAITDATWDLGEEEFKFFTEELDEYGISPE